jgi:hypothetical protein
LIDANKFLNNLDWTDISRQLGTEGYAMLPGMLDKNQTRDLAKQITTKSANRLPLASCHLGQGDLLYFGANLPEPLQTWHTLLYRKLVNIANQWNKILHLDILYPNELQDFLDINNNVGQTKPQSYLNRLGAQDYQLLHQRNKGIEVFPLQIVALLSRPNVDFRGGQFVMTQQRPRMQSRPLVVPLDCGDAAIIATASCPFKGTNGYYRVQLRHAISRVLEGERIGLELSFHQAT